MHRSGGYDGAGCLVEDLDYGISSRGTQGILDVSDAEEEDEDESGGEAAVDDDGLDEDFGDDYGGVADFFAHVDSTVES